MEALEPRHDARTPLGQHPRPTERKDTAVSHLDLRRAAAALRRTAPVLALPLAIAAVAAGAPAGSAAAPTHSGAMTFSGALRGTVKITRLSTCTGSPHGLNWDLGAKLSPSKATNWSVTIVTQHSGSWKTFHPGQSLPSFVLQSGLNGWAATTGSLTVSGTSGKVNLTLGAHEGSATGTVHVTGSWNCS